MYNKLTTHCPYVTLCCVSQRHNKLVDQQLYGCTAGPGFKSQSRRCRVTVLCKTVHTHCASVHQAAKLVAALLRTAGVTAGLAESTGSPTAGFMTHVTAKNRDNLRNPTLGNRVLATFFTGTIDEGMPFK